MLCSPKRMDQKNEFLLIKREEWGCCCIIQTFCINLIWSRTFCFNKGILKTDFYGNHVRGNYSAKFLTQ